MNKNTINLIKGQERIYNKYECNLNKVKRKMSRFALVSGDEQ